MPHSSNYQPITGALTVRQAKHRKDRGLFVTNEAKRALAGGLMVRGAEPGPLFQPVDKVGRIQSRRLSAQAVYAMLKQRAERLRSSRTWTTAADRRGRSLWRPATAASTPTPGSSRR